MERTRLGGVCSAAHGQGHSQISQEWVWAQQKRVGWQLGLVRQPLRAGLAPTTDRVVVDTQRGSDRLTLGYRVPQRVLSGRAVAGMGIQYGMVWVRW